MADHSHGTLYGVGVGPGDPELMTLKAARVLAAAPVVAYIAAADGASLARAIAAAHLARGHVEIALPIPMAEDEGPAQVAYDEATEAIGAHLAAGRDVAVLCQGDPLFYGSFMYLLARMQGAFPVAVVPGVTSVSAATALSLTALARRTQSLVVVPATLGEDALAVRLAGAEAAAIVKVGRHLPKVRTVLDRLGMTARAHYVERAGMAGERVARLAEVGDDAAPYFSIVLVAPSREAAP